jgi:5-methyltetrahydrofolate--homocysteine methyltransferase
VDPLTTIRESVLSLDEGAAEAAARAALAGGIEPQDIVTGAISPALDEVGRRFEQGDYFLPELLLAGLATKAIFDVLRPILAGRGIAAAGRVAIGTVRGDLHDIGKNLVAAMLEGAGFEVVDLGIDVPPERFAAAAVEKQADVIGISALLTTTLPAMKATVEAIDASGLRPRVKVIVGGASVTPGFAREIGADAYAASAASAVEVVQGLVATSGAAGQSEGARS